MGLISMKLAQNSVLVNNMKVADFVITEDLLSSCSHASSRHKMYLMEKKTDKEQTEKAKQKNKKKTKQKQKQNIFPRRTDSSKEGKEGAKRVAEQMVEAADKTSKEAEKRKDTVGMKTLSWNQMLQEINLKGSRKKTYQHKTRKLRK